MLINFRCANYRSFRDEVMLSMLKGDTKNHPDQVYGLGDAGLLKAAVIFGPNASGKSNVFNAFRVSRNFITKEIEMRTYNNYYRLEPGYKEKPTLFEYEMTVNGKPYRYGFEKILDDDEVTGEWLQRISLEGEDELLFRRAGDNIIDGEISENEKAALTRNIKKHGGLLILTLCDLFRDSKKGYDIIEESITILDWFDKDLVIIGVDGSLRASIDYTPSELEEMGRILRAFDVGINDIEFTEWIKDLWIDEGHNTEYSRYIDGKEGEVAQAWIDEGRTTVYGEQGGKIILTRFATERKNGKKREMLVSRHGANKVNMPRIDESDGTKRLLDLAPIIMNDNLEKTYVVDEIDRSLHPVVVFEFLKWFLENRYSKPKQLITTTHQILLMDQELLRKDEIWFVEKKGDGHSELFSLDEYNERSDKKIDKSYLDGRYGAIPKIRLRGDQ